MVVRLPGNKTDNRREEPTVDATELVEKIILLFSKTIYQTMITNEDFQKKKAPNFGSL